MLSLKLFTYLFTYLPTSGVKEVCSPWRWEEREDKTEGDGGGRGRDKTEGEELPLTLSFVLFPSPPRPESMVFLVAN